MAAARGIRAERLSNKLKQKPLKAAPVAAFFVSGALGLLQRLWPTGDEACTLSLSFSVNG